MNKDEPKPPYGHLAILKLSQIVAFDCTLGDAAKRVFMIIAGYSSHNDYSCYPSASNIAKALGMTHPAVTKQINILADHQYLKKTPRFCSKTRRKESNILTFNMDLAVKYYAQPDIFCQRNVTVVVTYLATLLRYGLLQPEAATSHETLESCKKKTPEKNILKKPWEDTASKKAKIRAGAWEQEKEREAKTGITKAHNQRLEALNQELRLHMSQNAIVELSLSVRRQATGLIPLDAINMAIRLYEEKLQEFQRGALQK